MRVWKSVEPLLVSSMQRRYTRYITAHGKMLTVSLHRGYDGSLRDSPPKKKTGKHFPPQSWTGCFNDVQDDQSGRGCRHTGVWTESDCSHDVMMPSPGWMQLLAFHQRLNNPLQQAHTVPTQRIRVFFFIN